MRETRIQTMSTTPVARHTQDGIARFASPAPAYHAHTTGYPYGATQQGAGAGSGRRTMALGLAGLAVIATGFGVAAYLRTQEAATAAAPVVAVATVPQSVYAQQVPLAARLTVPASVVAEQVPRAAAVTLAADLRLAQSVYAQQVPLAARLTVPASVVAQQVPTARVAAAVPRGALAELSSTIARAGDPVPASVVAQQVPTAPAPAAVPHGALAELAS